MYQNKNKTMPSVSSSTVPQKPVIFVDTQTDGFSSGLPLLPTSKISPLSLCKLNSSVMFSDCESWEGHSDNEDGISKAESAEYTNSSRASSVYSMDEIELLYEDSAHDLADVKPLSIQCFVHAMNQHRYQLLVRMTTKKPLAKEVSCTVEATKGSKSNGNGYSQNIDVFLTAQLAGFDLNPSTTGNLRLVSEFQHNKKLVKAYLFQRTIVVLATSSDGFDDILSVFDLEERTTVVGRSPQGLLFIRDDNNKLALEGANDLVAAWISLVNGTSPLQALNLSERDPVSLCRPEYTTLDIVVCTPLGHVSSIIPSILSAMGPQDRLAVVVVATDGSTGWIPLHKPSWVKWSDITKLDLDSLCFFSQSSSPILETARILLEKPTVGRQQSILVIAGCPLATTTVYSQETVHVVGIGAEYDLDMMTSVVQQSLNGRFYHVESSSALSNCCARIVTADKTYLHHNTVLKVRLAEKAVATNYKYMTAAPLKGESKHNEVVLPIGNLISGQSFVSVIEVDAEYLKIGQTLAECSITSTSAITGRGQLSISRAIVENEVTPPITAQPVFFDRLLLVCTDILKECQRLASQKQFEEIFKLLENTAQNILNITSKATKLSTDDAKELVGLSEPDHSYEALILKSRQLARSLLEVKVHVDSCYRSNMTFARAILYEAFQVLETQFATSNKTLLEGLFFEELDCNFI